VSAARGVPALPLARLRAAGEVMDIDARALAFSLPETAGFMQRTGAPALSAEQVGRLHARTEGWAASLQLAAIALGSADDVDAFLQQFSGADRDVADFLMEEVFNRQPPALRDFLLATSILERFDHALCDALLDSGGSRALIDEVERRDLFLLSLDRERACYRYHRLFADLLRQRLQRTRPQTLPLLHRRACDWLAADGQTEAAIAHAFAAGDMERAGALVDHVSTPLFVSGRTATLRALAARLPPAVADAQPRLQLELAWEHTIRWRFAEARHALAAVEAHADLGGADGPALHARLAHRQFMLQVFTDDLDGALTAGQAWLAVHGGGGDFMSGSVAVAQMMCERESHRCALTAARAAAFRQRFADTGALYGMVFSETVIGSTHAVRGELALARAAFEEAGRAAVRIHGEASLLAAMPAAQLAALAYEGNRLGEADALLERCAVAHGASTEFGLVDSVIARHLTAARLARARRQNDAAHLTLDRGLRLADEYRLPRLRAHLQAERVRLYLLDGHVKDAARLLAGFAPPGLPPAADVFCGSDRVALAMAQARIDFEHGAHADVLARLRRWTRWAAERQCLSPALRLSLLLAALARRCGDLVTARHALADALRWRGSADFVRSFVDEGEDIRALLAEQQGDPLCGALLGAFDGGEAALAPTLAAPDDPRSLSARELDILGLTAANLQTAEIAARLGLADTTVKWYWKRIFEKLGVRRRPLAVRAARQRGLIA
jgi:LuxR family maltose regulon positive regulatory protein